MNSAYLTATLLCGVTGTLLIVLAWRWRSDGRSTTSGPLSVLFYWRGALLGGVLLVLAVGFVVASVVDDQDADDSPQTIVVIRNNCTDSVEARWVARDRNQSGSASEFVLIQGGGVAPLPVADLPLLDLEVELRGNVSGRPIIAVTADEVVELSEDDCRWP